MPIRRPVDRARDSSVEDSAGTVSAPVTATDRAVGESFRQPYARSSVFTIFRERAVIVKEPP